RRHLRLLESVGLLATVREGTTDEYRPPHMAEGNVVPVYVLTLPLYVLPDVPGGVALVEPVPGPSAPQDDPDGASPALDVERAPGGRTRRPAPRSSGESSARSRLRAIGPEEVSALFSDPVDI